MWPPFAVEHGPAALHANRAGRGELLRALFGVSLCREFDFRRIIERRNERIIAKRGIAHEQLLRGGAVAVFLQQRLID